MVRPLLRLLPPEAAHDLTLCALRFGLVRKRARAEEPILSCRVWDLDFVNPIGLAAGFDKDAEVVDALLRLGLGFVEAGTVTPLAQLGNSKPRLFRLGEDAAVINRFGFNSKGLALFAKRLAARRKDPRRRNGIVGANLGKNRYSEDPVADYVEGVSRCAPLADYLVINISSPNTPGLRELHGRARLGELLERVLVARDEACAGARRKTPLLLKIAPDLVEGDREDIAGVVLESGADGLVVSNTTTSRPEELASRHRDETGGLSGRPLFTLSTRVLRDMYLLTKGKIPLIGVGGVGSGGDAYHKIRSGASLVQLYTALSFEGPGLIGRIKSDLADLLRRDGFASVGEAVGADLT